MKASMIALLMFFTGQRINLGTLPLEGFLGEKLDIVVAEPGDD